MQIESIEIENYRLFRQAKLPHLFPHLNFLCVPHEGKQDLEKSIPRELRAWREPAVRFCVLRDNDGSDCEALKVLGARKMRPLLDRNNASRSFRALVAGLERIVSDLHATPGAS
jgi:hypothetical protein